jgi:hypothetical protein
MTRSKHDPNSQPMSAAAAAATASGRRDAVDRVTAGRAWSWPVKLLVSMALLVHFAILALSYFSNNSLQRSNMADTVLQSVQPYTIPMGWYVELAPLSFVTGEAYERAMKIEFKKSQTDSQWATFVDSSDSDARWKRLVTLAGALEANEDSDGLGLIAHSIAAKATRQGTPVDQIRFAATNESGSVVTVYQAKIIALDNKELTIVPILDPTRSVPVTPSTAKQPGGS